jgi:hypothetical protein
MNFDSLESVLLGDHTWADELSMDEMSAVSGGYGCFSISVSPTGSIPTSGAPTYTISAGY